MRKSASGLWPLFLVLALVGMSTVVRAQDPPAPQDPKQTDPKQMDQEKKDQEKKDQEKADPQKKDETRLQVYDEIQVTGRASDMLGVADSASQGVTGHADLEKRPILRPGELLETVPGVIITQHSGGGKANQYFLRGFNLDHGTDFRVTVDDIPVNMPSHGHGQGYSDLNFLIPELVDTVRYQKGAYDAAQGDFSAAGAADITYVTSLSKGIAQITPGTEGYGRLLAADSKRVGDGDLLGAVELGRNNGPWVRPDDYRKVNGLVRWNRGDAANGLTVTAMGYDGRWNSTDQIPDRAVTEGLISRFGNIDPTDQPLQPGRRLAARERGHADAGERLCPALRAQPLLELHLLPRRPGERRPIRADRPPHRGRLPGRAPVGRLLDGSGDPDLRGAPGPGRRHPERPLPYAEPRPARHHPAGRHP